MVSDGKGLGSVMRNVSKAKFDGSLLQFALFERAEQMTAVWLPMVTLRANLVRNISEQMLPYLPYSSGCKTRFGCRIVSLLLSKLSHY